MVIITAAAVSAGAYGALKGAKASMKAAKDKIQGVQLERRHKPELAAKSKDRKSRMAAIVARSNAAQQSRAGGANDGSA